jgi:uncharacterized protein YdaU (DUF1376 family)
MNFYPFHIGDYISHTSHLTDEEDLAYRRMIDLYYMTESPLPNDYAWIARRVKSSKEVISELLKEFFELEDDGLWHSSRADKEIAKYQYLSESGKKGAEKRWANKDAKDINSLPNSLPNATPIATKNQEPLPRTNIKTTVPKVTTPDGVSVDLWNDFLVYRKRLKAPVTDRVLVRLIKEAELAKMPLDQVLETIIFKGWRSFEASWITQAAQKAKEMPLGTNEQIEAAYRQELGKDPAQARFNSYFDMRNYIVEQREKRKTA